MADADDYNYEIYSKVWCQDARGVLDKHATSAVAMWQAEHDGRLQYDGDCD